MTCPYREQSIFKRVGKNFTISFGMKMTNLNNFTKQLNVHGSEV